MTISQQLLLAFVIAIPVASIAWTVTHEEIFREIREYCVDCSEKRPRLFERKFFYIFTCEYCFSHYVTILFLLITRFKLVFPDWRGYLLSFFTVVWIANIYMNLYGRIRLDIKRERIEISAIQEDLGEATEPDRKEPSEIKPSLGRQRALR